MSSVVNPVPPLFRSTFTANRTPLRPLVVTKFATLQRQRGIQGVINLCALCDLCVQNKNAIVFYLTQRPQRTQNFQSKLRCRWSRRWLRATENAKAKQKRNHPPPPSLRSLPSVAMGIATLRGYRMTSSHSSKDPLRPPVSEGQLVSAVFLL